MARATGASAQAGRGERPRFGAKIRLLRRRDGLSQADLAARLAISPSYLNLIENNKRPLPATLLVELAKLFDVNLDAFASDQDARTLGALTEVFADPLFDEHELTSADMRELMQASPATARAILALYEAYEAARESADHVATHLSEEEELPGGGGVRSHLPSEEVSELLQRHGNHFPELEHAAEALRAALDLEGGDLYSGLSRFLERDLGVAVQIVPWGEERGVLRRYDGDARVLSLSELLPTRSRTFQLAHQTALLTQAPLLDRIAADPRLTSDDARALARVALANYFAGALLMPYREFLAAAEQERYDIDVLGRRFRVGFEQVCHRLTTLRRPGAEGVPFHMIRIDVAGNISKRFSASGIHFARFSGACPRWNIFSAFLTPGMIRIQVSSMPDGATYFCIARTIQRDSGGYHAQHPVQAIGLGCRVEHAKQLVYSDGIELESAETCVPVGVTCRLCERSDCAQRAVPSLKMPLRVDENVRNVSLYSTGRGHAPRAPRRLKLADRR